MEHQDVEVIDMTGLSLASSDDSPRNSSRETSKDASRLWYQDPRADHPFSMTIKCKAPQTSASPFSDVAFFPWGDTPFRDLWSGNGHATGDDSISNWCNIRSKWRNSAAICGGGIVRLIKTSPLQRGAPIFQISLPVDCDYPLTHVRWALNPRDLHPLILYVHSSVLHIFDVETRNFLGHIRGHGGDITSLGVNHTHPHIVFTTSRDFTTRIYDLGIVSGQGTPHSSSRRRRMSAFGRAESDDGNSRVGKCVMVLTGGRSGGHEAAVLGADFHPSLPLIATCGMDHAVRVWHLKPELLACENCSTEDAARLYREDKPLFSSSFIHDARVLSVYWLSFDLLVSHSAAPTRTAQIGGGSKATESGTLAVWKWLSIGRFFPPQAPVHREPPLRGCISDYRESSSFKMISVSRLPDEASQMSVHRLRHGPPLILVTVRSKILLLNASQLAPRNRPILRDERDVEEAPQSKRVIRLSGPMDEDSARTDVEGWSLSVALGEDLEDEELEGCALSSDGESVAAVGTREGVWMWNTT